MVNPSFSSASNAVLLPACASFATCCAAVSRPCLIKMANFLSMPRRSDNFCASIDSIPFVLFPVALQGAPSLFQLLWILVRVGRLDARKIFLVQDQLYLQQSAFLLFQIFFAVSLVEFVAVAVE